MNGLAEVAKQIQEMMLNQLRQQLFGNTETLLVPTVVLTTQRHCCDKSSVRLVVTQFTSTSPTWYTIPLDAYYCLPGNHPWKRTSQ